MFSKKSHKDRSVAGSQEIVREHIPHPRVSPHTVPLEDEPFQRFTLLTPSKCFVHFILIAFR